MGKVIMRPMDPDLLTNPAFIAASEYVDGISERGDECARSVAEVHFTAFEGEGPADAYAEAVDAIEGELERLYAKAGIPEVLRTVLIRKAHLCFQIRLNQLRLTAAPGGAA